MAGTTRYAYTGFGALQSEDGPWADDTVTYTYANHLRRSLSLAQPNASAWPQTYAYDAMKRLTNVTSAAGPFGHLYSYAGAANTLLALIRMPTVPNVNGSLVRVFSYDAAGRLSWAGLSNDEASLDQSIYTNNVGGQRVTLRRRINVATGGPESIYHSTNTVDYTYDAIGQLKTALGKETGGAERFMEKLGYTYDAAGNLNYRTNHTLLQTFNTDSLNQLTTVTRGRGSVMTVAGTTTSAATNVTVNTSNTLRYADRTFASTNHTLADGTNTFTAIALDDLSRADTHTISVYLPNSVSFLYDQNGNLRTNGTRVFQYDDENQLICITEPGSWMCTNVYDGKMRRRVEQNYSWTAGAWVLTSETRFVYDGNVILQERDSFNLPKVTLTRGLDLSGTLQGAGGIGGLLAITEHALLNAGATTNSHFYYHADGNGNVTCLADVNQNVVARYLYDPFGNALSATGPKGALNRYRFSSKPIHEACGMYDYLYRWYVPESQRWPNRDPINELGFKALIHRNAALNRREEQNLYRFIGNNSIKYSDYLGLDNPGCDPPGDEAIKRCPANKDCMLRCCAEHDKCYYDNGCSASSWIIESSPECLACNGIAATCMIMCKVGKGPTKGPRWFCANGPNKGKFYDDYSKMPADCWKGGKKPPTPQPDIDPAKGK